jgi:hypothetical protein
MNAQDKQNTSSYIRPSLSPIEVTYGKGSLIKPNEIKFSGAVDITKLKNQSLEIGAVSTGTNSQFDTSGVSTFDKKVMASTFNFALDLIETNLYPKGGDKMDFSYLNNRATNSISQNQMISDNTSNRGESGESNFSQENKTRTANRFYLGFYTVEKMEWKKDDAKNSKEVTYNGRFILVKFDDFERFLFKTYRKEYKELKKLTPAQLQEKFKYSFADVASKFGGSKISRTIVGSASGSIKDTEVLGVKIKAPTDESLIADAKQAFADDMQEIITRRVEDFQVVTPLLSLKPYTGNIGTKEGLKIDNRYMIYEILAQDSLGNPTKKQKVSTFRVKKATNNSITTSTTAPSVFYKIGGGKPDIGMLMQNKEDVGVGISVGYGNDAFVRLDYRLKGISTGLKVYLDIHPLRNITDVDKMEFNNEAFENLLGLGGLTIKKPLPFIFNAALGVEKTLMAGSRLGLTPFIGGGLTGVMLAGDVFEFTNSQNETVTAKYDDKESILYSAFFANGGVRLNLFLSANLSLVSSVGYSMPIMETWNDVKVVNSKNPENFYYIIGATSDKQTKSEDQVINALEWSKVITNAPKAPSGLIYNIMLRYEF